MFWVQTDFKDDPIPTQTMGRDASHSSLWLHSLCVIFSIPGILVLQLKLSTSARKVQPFLGWVIPKNNVWREKRAGSWWENEDLGTKTLPHVEQGMAQLPSSEGFGEIHYIIFAIFPKSWVLRQLESWNHGMFQVGKALWDCGVQELPHVPRCHMDLNPSRNGNSVLSMPGGVSSESLGHLKSWIPK